MSPTKLRTLRARHRVTQRELASATGLWQARISDLETGRAKMLQREEEAIQGYFANVRLARRVREGKNGHE